MSIPGYSVRNRVTMTMLYTFVIAFGIFSFARLQLDLYPDMDIPYIIVLTTYVGASPQDVETLLSRPIEDTAVSVTGVKNVMSTSKENVSMVSLEFDWGYDMDQAEIDTRNKLDLVKGTLPDEAETPIVIAMDPSMQPIVMFNLIGDRPASEIRKIAEDRIKPLLERVDGVSSAEVGGGELRQIHVRLNPQKLEAYKINPTAVYGVIKAENTQGVGGYIEASGRDLSIQTTGKFRSVDEIGEALVSMGYSDTGQLIPIRLKDIADIEDTYEESRRFTDVNGESSVFMMVSKQSGANTVETANDVLEKLPKIVEQEGMKYHLIFNQGEFIEKSIGNLESTVVMAVLIVFVVLLIFFRSVTTSLIVATAIPTSLMATFGFMSMMNMSLNVISMAGLSLAVGMLVDNAIVVLENIFRHRTELKESPFQAAVKGAKEVTMAIAASSMTTIAVFLPILFVPGIAGMMFRDMSLVICGALIVSLVVAITFVPMLAYYLLKNKRFDKVVTKNSGAEKEDLSDLSEEEKQSFTNRMRVGYESMLGKCVKRRGLVVLGVVGLFVLSVLGFGLVPTEFMPTTDDSFISIKYTTEIGTDASTTYKIGHDIADIVKKVIPDKERKLINVDAGASDSGFSAIMSGGVNSGTIRVPLVKPEFRDRSITQIMDSVREALKDVPGITYQVQGRSGPGASGGGDIDVEIYLDDIEQTRQITNTIKRTILTDDKAKWPDVAEIKLSVEEQKPQVKIEFNREKMSELGLSTSTVGTLVTIFFRGVTASEYLDKGDEYDIIVRYDRAFRNDIHEIENMPIQTQSGEIVPLSTVAKIYEDLAPTQIDRKNQRRYQKVSLTLANEYKDPKTGKTMPKDMDKTITKLKTMLDQMVAADEARKIEWSYRIGGTAENFLDSFMYLKYALGIAILLVYMVMASQFESYREPLIVMFTVPLAIIGVVAIFLITGRTIDIAGLIGLIMLVGIVVNNGIVMVDAANQNRERGMSKNKAIISAARTRMRPIMMTALTTILSMIPLALKIGEGSEMWSGMGTAVIGGLSVATFITLFFVPVMYSLIASNKYEVREYEEEEDHIHGKKNASEMNAAVRRSQVMQAVSLTKEEQ